MNKKAMSTEEIARQPRFVSTEVAARIFNVSPRTMVRMASSGKVRAVKIMTTWRIDKDDLLERAGIELPPAACGEGAA